MKNNPHMQAMLDRFLGWKLPSDFGPDAGISFAPTVFQKNGIHPWPTGTNLLNSEQARAMLEYCTTGIEQTSNRPDFGTTYDGRIKTYPLVEMGHGLVSVAQSEIDGENAVIFIKLSNHVPIGETVPSPEGKTHFDVEQMAAAITFKNTTGLDVLIAALQGLRAKMLATENGGR